MSIWTTSDTEWQELLPKLREKVVKVGSIKESAKEIGMSDSTLRKYVYRGQRPSWVLKTKIQTWVLIQ